MVHMSTGRQCGFDTTVLFSFLVNITFQRLVLFFFFLVQTVGYLTRGGLQCLYMFRVYIRIIMESSTHTETVRGIAQSPLIHYCPGIFYLPAQKLTSPTCLSSEGLDAQSRPRPDEETKYSAERGWNAGLYRFLYRPASRTGECWCFTKPF